MSASPDFLADELLRLAREARLQSRSRHPALALQRLAGTLQSLARSLDAADEKSPLSGREREILGHVANGFTNREIARALDVSEKTVEFHLSSIFTKTETSTRTEAVTVALRAHWLPAT
jgi:DNA-binding NarL/FixJ family response regulator